MTHRFADPARLYPVLLPDGSPHLGTVFLRPALTHPRITVGDFSYASAHTPPSNWAAHLAPYLYPTSPERLRIGAFCQIADGVQFITASANHRRDGFSTFPFAIFDDGPMTDRASLPGAGPDTIVGHDVWIGQGARILPGARIGNGVIVGAGAVVTGTVPDYSVVTGNPAQLVRMRFAPDIVAALNEISWWHWPIAAIQSAEAAICAADIAALRAQAPTDPAR